MILYVKGTHLVAAQVSSWGFEDRHGLNTLAVYMNDGSEFAYHGAEADWLARALAVELGPVVPFPMWPLPGRIEP